jgi:transcriptional regulator with XRE-family HTH domain
MKRPRHIIATIRTMLGLTQKQFAARLELSWHTVQALENRHLELSERIANLIAVRTGIKMRHLLRNEMPDPPPEPAELRKHFRGTEYAHPDRVYVLNMIPRLQLSRLYILQLGIVKELGHSDAFFDLLRDACLEGLELIGNSKLARQIYAEARAVEKGGTEALGRVLVSEGQNLQDMARKIKARKEAAARRAAGEAPLQGEP